ncbi:hypothetical protein B0H14DRAFT_3490474 [Mycena olivaceomarginata]|nr:hypothetical protein B0H14DRAFT_3490474 [Mycena olivaceomarginata]
MLVFPPARHPIRILPPSHRFRDAVLGRPSVALLDVVALWGAHLSKSHSLLSFEALFLDRARQHIAADVSADKHSPHYLHTIQALVLLSTYLLRTKQFIEAEFYANGAATLVLGHRSTRIAQARTAPP